jgi:SAM-dependent methyltransferase
MATNPSTVDTPDRATELERISSYQIDRATPEFLVYHYLIPCIERAGGQARGRLLDIGCGNKPYQSLFPHVAEFFGCDVVQSSLKRVDLLCYADAIPQPDASFDVILCTQTIEHVANFSGLLREAYRLLKPGGTLFISGPMYWYHHEVPHDFHRFTSYGFRHGLEQAKFTVDHIEPNGGKWSVLGLVILHTLPSGFRGRRTFNRLVNTFFLWLDRRHFDPINTSNFFGTARRPLNS